MNESLQAQVSKIKDIQLPVEPIYSFHKSQLDGGLLLRLSKKIETRFEGQVLLKDPCFWVPQKNRLTSYVYEYSRQQLPKFGGHRFKYSLNEQSDPSWKLERVAFEAYKQPQPFTVPIYIHEIQQEDGKRYIYSKNKSQVQFGWKSKGQVAFYAYDRDPNPN